MNESRIVLVSMRLMAERSRRERDAVHLYGVDDEAKRISLTLDSEQLDRLMRFIRGGEEVTMPLDFGQMGMQMQPMQDDEEVTSGPNPV